jgi:hypothetical protein
MRSLLTLSALLSTVSALTNPYPTMLADGNVAISYFGSITAEVFLASTVSETNYNGTITCPREWDLGTLDGAHLRLYPGVIDSYNDAPYPGLEQGGGLAMRAELMAGHFSSALSYNIDGVDMSNILITNGSTPGPFMNGGTPAILAPDPEELANGPWSLVPVWTINGTQSAFVVSSQTSPEAIYLQCDNSRHRGYCGYFQDTHQNGCWSRQPFLFGVDEQPSNFSIRFSNNEATFDIWVESEFNSTGVNSVAHIVFRGDRNLPSITDYDFWEQSPLDYELAREYTNAMRLEADEENMPVFRNETSTRDWWATVNGTFYFESGAARDRGSWVVWVFALACAGWLL